MSLTQSQALAAFGVALATMSGLSAPADQPLVYRGQRDRPRPDVGSYRLTVLSDVGVGRSYRVSSTALEQHRQLTVQVDAIGATVQEPAIRIHALLRGDSPGMRTLQAAGVAVQGVTDLLDASAILQTSFEPRSLFTVRLGYVLALTNAAQGVEATSIVLSATGELLDGDELDADDVATVVIP